VISNDLEWRMTDIMRYSIRARARRSAWNSVNQWEGRFDRK